MNEELMIKMEQARKVILQVEQCEQEMHMNQNNLYSMHTCLEQCEKEQRISKNIINYVVFLILGIIILWCLKYTYDYTNAEHVRDLFELNIKNDISECALFGMWGIGIYTLLFWTRFLIQRKKYQKKLKAYTQARCNSQDYYNQSVVKSYELLPAIEFIPKEYQYSIAINFFCDVLRNGRADSFKECMNLYEEQLHRWKIENGVYNIGRLQNITNARLNAIERKVT